MVLPPKELMLRLVFWAAVFVWAVVKIKDFGAGGGSIPGFLAPPPETAPVAVPLPRPAEGVAAPAAGEGVDAAVAEASRCGVAGTLTVTLGPGGVTEASVTPTGAAPDAAALACLTTAVWTSPWPTSELPFTVTSPLTP